jgi:hypothetical protein
MPLQSPLPEMYSVSYHNTEKTIASQWFRRLAFSTYNIAYIVILVCIAFSDSISFFVFGKIPYWAMLSVFIIIATNLITYWITTKAVANDSLIGIPKKLEFSYTQIRITGADFKTELPWNYFKSFSEDKNYFWLHLRKNKKGLDSLFPKSAFTSEQQEAFRRFAHQCNTER